MEASCPPLAVSERVTELRDELFELVTAYRPSLSDDASELGVRDALNSAANRLGDAERCLREASRRRAA